MKNSLFKLLLPPLLSIALIGGLFALKGHTRFNESVFSIDQVQKHLEVLSSSELSGRGLAEIGQARTENYMESFFKKEQLDYVVVPNKILVPSWDQNTQFQIGESNLSLFKDFEPTANYYGKGLSFNGEILYTGQDFFSIDPKLMKDRLVFFYATRLTEEHLLHAQNAGAKGILYTIAYNGVDISEVREFRNHKTLDLSAKKNNTLFMAEVSPKCIQLIEQYASQNPLPAYSTPNATSTNLYASTKLVGIVPQVKVEAKLHYQLTECKNYIVSFKGNTHKKLTNFITHYDGRGLAPTAGNYYPSTIEGGASSSLFLELARTVKQQRVTPINDINFIFLSGMNINDSSAKLVAERLKADAPYHANFIVESIAYKNSAAHLLNWDSYNDLDRMLVSQLSSNMDLFPVPMLSSENGIYTDFERYNAFKSIDHATLFMTDEAVSGSFTNIGSPNDNLSLFDNASMNNLSKLFIGHLDQQLFKEQSFLFIEDKHLVILLLLLLMVHLIALPEKWVTLKTAPKALETLSQWVPYKLLRKAVLGVLPFLLSIFVVNLVLSVPSNINLKTVADTVVTNFSLYDTFKNSYIGFIGFLGTLIAPEPQLFKEISRYLSRSLILIAWGIGLSILLGLFKGMLDAYFHKGRTGFSTLSGIVLYSIPDVLIAFVSLVAVVYLSKVSWVNRLVDANTLRLYIMPILSLTIVPIIYISRLVFVALEEEKKKDYVKFLHYKGLSKLQIYVGHFSKVALVKILDSSKAVIMLIFSNLIVVEYLFNYPGIMYNLLESSEDSTKVIILSLSIGLSFISIYLLSVLLLKLIHPGRRIR